MVLLPIGVVISVTEISYAALTLEMLQQDFYGSLARSLKCIGDADHEMFISIDQFEAMPGSLPMSGSGTRGDEEIRRFGHPPPSAQEPPTAVGLPQRAKRCAT